MELITGHYAPVRIRTHCTRACVPHTHFQTRGRKKAVQNLSPAQAPLSESLQGLPVKMLRPWFSWQNPLLWSVPPVVHIQWHRNRAWQETPELSTRVQTLVLLCLYWIYKPTISLPNWHISFSATRTVPTLQAGREDWRNIPNEPGSRGHPPFSSITSNFRMILNLSQAF